MQHRSLERGPCRATLAMGALAAAAIALGATPARAGIYLTGSGSLTTTTVPLQSYISTAASASLAVDLGRYIRLGYTYRKESQITDAYEPELVDPTGPTDGPVTLVKVYNRTDVVANSIDLTIILYEGEVFTPYILAGGVKKVYAMETRRDYQDGRPSDVRRPGPSTSPIQPNLGGGFGLRLNRQFSLKFQYVASPGQSLMPTGQIKSVWDKYTSVGLTYEL